MGTELCSGRGRGKAHCEHVGNADGNALFDVVMALCMFGCVPCFCIHVRPVYFHRLHIRHIRVVLHGVAKVELGATHAHQVHNDLELEAKSNDADHHRCKYDDILLRAMQKCTLLAERNLT